MIPRSMGPDMKLQGSKGPEMGPENVPEIGPEKVTLLGMGWRGKEVKEGVLSKAAARSSGTLVKEWNCSWQLIVRGVDVLALTEAPEMDLKEVSGRNLSLWVWSDVIESGILNLWE